MDWTIIGTIAVSILAAITGGTGILFYRERRRGEQIKNEASAATEWQKLFERSDQDVRERDAKIDRLYVELSRYRDVENQLTTENAILKMLKCEIKGCEKRIPPREY